MRRIHLEYFAVLVLLFVAGCSRPVAGIYQYEWRGVDHGLGGPGVVDEEDSYKTFDLRSDGVGVYTPHVLSNFGRTVDTVPIMLKWESHGNEILIINPDGSTFKFRREKDDLIAPGGERYIKIR